MRTPRWLNKRHRDINAGQILAAVTIASAAAIASVTANASAAAMATTTRTTAAPVPILHWVPCNGSFQCATAQVPLDYRQPLGKTINIAVIRHLAADPAHRLGSMFFNSGGPAEQIEGFIQSYPQIPVEVRARFDVVNFDPRGFGFSTELNCFPSPAAEHKFLAGLPLFPVGRSQQKAWERTAAGFDAQCASHGGPLLDHDSTADVARDMDLLRQAVGDPVLNYLGQSYGTAIGTDYANLFPARVGHMVFDGNIDPIAETHGGPLPTDLREGRDIGDAQTMRAFLNLCGKAAISACAFSSGTPAATTAKWDTLLQRLLRHPVTIGSPAQTWTYQDVITAFPEYSFSVWPTDAAILQQLWLASGARPVPTGAPPFSLEPSDGNLEQILAVGCADSPNPRDPRAYEAAAKLAYARSGAFGPSFTWMHEPCAMWPQTAAQDRYTGPWNRPTANPILLLGNTVDPSTPYSNSIALSGDLARARLLTIDGYGHTEFDNPSTCAENYEVGYLTTGALPPSGTVCQQDGTPFGVATH
jgi:pimeloyl-ACP methyl ester carboxylesterase